MGLKECVTCRAQTREAYRSLFAMLAKKRQLGDVVVHGRLL
jgi:hypothetical protein